MSHYERIDQLPEAYQRQAAAQLDVRPVKPRAQVTVDTVADVIRLTLQSPPSANRLYRNVRGKTLKSQVARQYMRQCKRDASQQVGRPPLVGDVSLTLHWYRPAKRGDVSNRIKIVEDALQGIAYENDKQVAELHVYRHEDKDAPRLEVEVRQR